MNKWLVSMSAAAVAAGAMAVESQNVVGVDTDLTSVQGFNFLAVPFVQVGYNTADIQQIQISDGGAGNIGNGEENFALWEGLPSVVANSGFFYWDDYNGGYYWEDDNGGQTMSIEPGQGFVIDCAAGLTFQLSGQVADTDAELTTVQGFNFYGNCFAEPIDIQDIQISDGGAGNIGNGEENFALWEGLPSVVANSGFFYWDDYSGGYYWEDDNGGQTLSIEPGQGFVIDCAAGLTVTIDSPYSLASNN